MMSEDPHARRAQRVNAASNVASRFIALFALYACAKSEISGGEFGHWAFDPDEVRWPAFFVAEEAALWAELKRQGLHFYPHYPVGRFFADFAHPRAKLAIDCGGSAFRRDWAEDSERRAHLLNRGWTSWSISTHDCLSQPEAAEESGLAQFGWRVRQFVEQRRALEMQASMARANGSAR